VGTFSRELAASDCAINLTDIVIEDRMSRRKRVIIAVIVLEVLLGLGWIWLSQVAASGGSSNPDAPRVIGQVMGAAMGILLGISPLLYLFARSNDRRAEESSRKP
jgi:hypothetical protein